MIGQSQTGTGKTASFALPVLERIKARGRHVQAIILTPTRELAMQVAKEIASLKGDKDVRILPVYGGSPIGPQRQKLKSGVDIVVGTPGRVMDLQRRKSLRLDNIQFAVLDEADEMLNMGFVEDIETILENSPKDKNMLLFSATMPKAILKIAKKYMREYEFIETKSGNVTIETVEQTYYEINARDRFEGIRRIIDDCSDFHGIIFCNTKASVDTITHQLAKMDYGAAALHGDITQSQREKILQQFRNKVVKVLVATDVAARGIDVNDLTHVINFSLPQSPEAYVHRIGRTGRAGKKGIAITFVIPSERRKLAFVERINKCKLIKKTLPSAKQIVDHKEKQIKVIIDNIISSNKDKDSKYNTLAQELLKDNPPNKVLAAILRYSFKNQLEASSYKSLSPSRDSKDSTSFKGRSRAFSRDRGSRRFSGSSKSRESTPRRHSGGSGSGRRSDDKKPRSSKRYDRDSQKTSKKYGKPMGFRPYKKKR